MKNTSLWIRTAIIIAITLAGIYLVIGPRGRTPNASDLTWQGIKDNLANNINLGLDLKGGSHLVMRVKTDDYLKTMTENNAQAALTAAQDAQLPVAGNSIVAENGRYSISLELSDPSQVDAVAEAVKKKVDVANWTQSTSGNTGTWTLPSNIQTVLKTQAGDQALKIKEGAASMLLASRNRRCSGMVRNLRGKYCFRCPASTIPNASRNSSVTKRNSL